MKVKLNKRLKSEYNQIEKILALLTRKRQKEINNDPNNELDWYNICYIYYLEKIYIYFYYKDN